MSVLRPPSGSECMITSYPGPREAYVVTNGEPALVHVGRRGNGVRSGYCQEFFFALRFPPFPVTCSNQWIYKVSLQESHPADSRRKLR